MQTGPHRGPVCDLRGGRVVGAWGAAKNIRQHWLAGAQEVPCASLHPAPSSPNTHHAHTPHYTPSTAVPADPLAPWHCCTPGTPSTQYSLSNPGGPLNGMPFWKLKWVALCPTQVSGVNQPGG